MSAICHINLAKGFRGGERQTELLIRELSQQKGVEQQLIARNDSPLLTRLSGCRDVRLCPVSKPYLKHVRHIRGWDLMHVHEARAGQLAYLASKLLGIPYVITRRVPNPPGNNPFTRAVYTRASHITALSRAIREVLLAYRPGLAVSVIPSMVSRLQVSPAHAARLRASYQGFFLIGHAGALVNKHKGQKHLIEAAGLLRDRCPEMRFLLLGKGPDERWLQELASGLDNIELLGFQEDIGDYLIILDVFAFPSLQEGLGSILLDAMDFGLPIVASRVDGIKDLIEPGVNGLLVPPGDSAALARRLEELYKDRALRQRLGEQALETSKGFSPGDIAASYMRLYQTVLGRM